VGVHAGQIYQRTGSRRQGADIEALSFTCTVISRPGITSYMAMYKEAHCDKSKPGSVPVSVCVGCGGKAYIIAGLDGLVSAVNLLSFRRDPGHQANGERRTQLVVRDFVIEFYRHKRVYLDYCSV